MMRNIYLEGELGDTFIPHMKADVSSVQDALRLIEANFPTFKKYVVDCDEKNIGFTIEVAGNSLEDDSDIIFPLDRGDIVISTIPAGSKSGGAKIFAAIIILAFLIMNPLTLAGGGNLITAAIAGNLGTAATIATLTATSMAMSLMMTGIQQLMAPDPATDSDEPTSYMFNGSQQNVIEGDPVPILYGELRVPGTPIAFSVVNNAKIFNGGVQDGNGITVGTDQGLEVDNTSSIK